MSESDAAEVARLTEAYRKELEAPGEVGDALVRRLAVLTVRMDRCVKREAVAIAANVRRALESTEAPEDVSPAQLEKLVAEITAMAQFDPSKEACLVRKYEAAAERGFFRALKEIQLLKRAGARSAAAEVREMDRKSLEKLGSFLPKANNPAPAPRRPSRRPGRATFRPGRKPFRTWNRPRTGRLSCRSRSVSPAERGRIIGR